MGMAVTMEGVETRAQLERATRMGPDELQGYALAHPLEEIELQRLFLSTRLSRPGLSRPFIAG